MIFSPKNDLAATIALPRPYSRPLGELTLPSLGWGDLERLRVWGAARKWIAHWSHCLHIAETRFRKFRPKVPFRLERGNALVKTVDTWEEWIQVLRLRHELFHREPLGRRLPFSLDVDDIDFVCDHLAIFDRASGRIAGTYRLTSTLFSSHFYAERRFQLAPFLAMPGNKLELGRACVAREFRNGTTLHLLWRGISEYMRLTETKYLFGSASIRTTDAVEISRLQKYLADAGHLSPVFSIGVRPESAIPHLADNLEAMATGRLEFDAETVKRGLPSLFQSYLRAGARIASPPARDPFLGSADFLTVMSRDTMTASFERRYAK